MATVGEVLATLGVSMPTRQPWRDLPRRDLLSKEQGRILADTDLIVNAYRGDQAALTEIRAGTTFVTPLHRTEFLNVQERLARLGFLQDEGVITFRSSEKWILTESGPETWNVIDEVIQGGHSPADAVFGAVSRATGIEAVTAESRLPNFFKKSRQDKLGVNIRQVRKQ